MSPISRLYVSVLRSIGLIRVAALQEATKTYRPTNSDNSKSLVSAGGKGWCVLNPFSSLEVVPCRKQLFTGGNSCWGITATAR